jgi:hypothetical protein
MKLQAYRGVRGDLKAKVLFEGDEVEKLIRELWAFRIEEDFENFPMLTTASELIESVNYVERLDKPDEIPTTTQTLRDILSKL